MTLLIATTAGIPVASAGERARMTVRDAYARGGILWRTMAAPCGCAHWLRGQVRLSSLKSAHANNPVAQTPLVVS